MRKTLQKFASVVLVLSIGSCGCSKKDSFDDSERKTLDSFTKVADGIYVMDCYADYKMDEYLAANIKTVTEMDTWLTRNLTHGVPTDDTAVTNFILYEGKPMDPDFRYGKMHNKLDSVSAMTSSEAMGLLEAVNKGTLQDAHWSAVYNLESFSVDVCFNEDFSKVYSYTGTKSGN